MRKDQVRIGSIYKVDGYHGAGTDKAQVTGEAVKDVYSNKWKFPVRFLEPMPSRKNDWRSEGHVEVREFVQLWNDEDQANHEKRSARISDMFAREDKLAFAGYSFVTVSYRWNSRSSNQDKQELHIEFEGADAEAVYEKLTEGVDAG